MTTKSGKFAIALMFFVIVAIFAIPNLLSATFVKQRIADQLSQLTGRQVALEGSSSISLRPYLGVSYDNVVFKNPGASSGKPLIAIEKLRAKLGLFAALFGDAQLSEIEFIRPHFALQIDADGRPNWSLASGQLGMHIDNHDAKTSLRLGTIHIEEGIIELVDERLQETKTLTAINGHFSWPSTDSSANVEASAVLRGEIMEISASVAQPLEFLRGGKSDISVKLNANPLELSFDGMSNGTDRRFEGVLSLASPSPKRLADWIGWHLPAAQKLGNSVISGTVSVHDKNAEFPEALVTLGDHEGKGRLQISMDEDELITVSGTLAFESVALPNLHSVLLDSAGSAKTEEAFDLTFMEGLAMDVRLSANSASISPISMTNLAAAIIVKDGRANFDIGRAEAIGGAVSGAVNVQVLEKSISVVADLVATDVDFEQLTKVSQEPGVSLQGKGNVAVKLKSVGRDIDGLMLRLNGEGHLRGNDGVLIGLDLTEIFTSTNSGSDKVAEVSSGTTSYNTIDLGFFIANGTAFLDKSSIQADVVDVSLKGRIDLVKQTLALRGKIQDSSNDQGKRSDLPFFVGGTASSPLFVPLPLAGRSRENLPEPNKPAPDQ